jgi:hypothetical protein
MRAERRHDTDSIRCMGRFGCIGQYLAEDAGEVMVYIARGHRLGHGLLVRPAYCRTHTHACQCNPNVA